MQSIVIECRTSGVMEIYKPKYPAQRSLFEQKRAERILAAFEELEGRGNINIYLYKRGKLRKIA